MRECIRWHDGFYLCIYAWAWLHLCVHICEGMITPMRAHTRRHDCIHVCIYAWAWSRLRMHIRAGSYVCIYMQAWSRLCVHILVCAWLMYCTHRCAWSHLCVHILAGIIPSMQHAGSWEWAQDKTKCDQLETLDILYAHACASMFTRHSSQLFGTKVGTKFGCSWQQSGEALRQPCF